MKKISLSLLTLFALIVPFQLKQAHAAANITVKNANVTSANTVLVAMNNPGANLFSVDYTKWHIDQNDGGATPLDPTSATITSPSGWILQLTFAGTPFSDPATAYDAAHGLYVDALGVTDADGDTNAVVGHASSKVITDAQSPTLTVVSIASNNSTNTAFAKPGDTVTVTMTADEPLDIDPGDENNPTMIAGTDVGASVVNTSGNTYQYSYTMQSSDTAGVVAFEMNAMDVSFNEKNTDPVTATTDSSSVTFDKTDPIISETAPVTTPTSSLTPSYTYTASEAGTLSYGGDCTGSTTVQSGANTINFNRLSFAVHSNCTITETDYAGNISNIVNVTPFEIIFTPSSEGAGGGLTTNPNDIPEATVQIVTTPTSSPAGSSTRTPFMSVYLRKGNRNDQVAKLQQFLKERGFFTYPSITGFFSTYTEAAVKAFQEKYAADILTPQQLTQPTGFVMNLTLAKINLLSCSK